jgi:membrane fusion protein, multidrug efflux system
VQVTEQPPDSNHPSKSEPYTTTQQTGTTFSTENSTAQKYAVNRSSTGIEDRQPAGRSRWWIWALGVVLVITAIILWQRHSSNSEAKASADPATRPTLISTATARQGDIGIFLNALGTVTPVYTVTVTSRVQGEITQVYYHEGQMVKKGDPLIEIDPRPYQAALTQVEGQLAHDTAVLNEAKIDLNRYKEALDRNAIAKQQYDDQQQVVLQDEGTVKNDEGQLANAKVNLVYTHITAPIAGRVGLRLVDPGNIVQANSTTPLVVITQLQPITVIFSIAEDSLNQIQQQLRKGKKLSVDALDRAQSTKIASGTLLTLDNVIDPTTGTLKLKAVFDNKDNALFPSQFVNIRLLVDTQKNMTLIPTPAIQRNAQGAYVYVISNSTATIRNITPGTTDGSVTAVTGIQPQEVLATNGFDKLVDGGKVSVRQPGKNNAAAGASGQTAQNGNNTNAASSNNQSAPTGNSNPGSAGPAGNQSGASHP